MSSAHACLCIGTKKQESDKFASFLNAVSSTQARTGVKEYSKAGGLRDETFYTGTLCRQVPLTNRLVPVDKIEKMRPTRTSSQILPRIDDCECTPSIQHLFRRHYLLQSPMYYIRWLYAVIYSLYLLFVLRSRDPTDTDIVGYIENTTMAILVRPATDGKLGEYEVTFCDCKLRTSGGYKLKNMLLRYKTGKNGVHILRFIRNGVEVTDRSQIFSTIYFYHIHSMHTKSHLFSNSLVRNIVNNDVKTLQESSYTSIPLHYQLLHSSLSVLEWDGNMSRYLGYGDACIRESIVEESRNMSALEGHQAVHRWNSHGKDSFAGKLFRSRLALQDVMERHGIDPKMLDALFNHTIVHSVDHHGISERSFLRFSLHPCTWDKDCSTYRAFNTSVFRVLITQPNLNPLAPNTLRFINKPFYQDLYRELKNIDPQMAEVSKVCASTSSDICTCFGVGCMVASSSASS
ncbi:uncharacterized protein LOC118408656 [Branchiostoma floridae]|uniref:Uncharacterized protein LOC118408656 n=1 Tax=Branchiostoma floridae TaxID=7739 RepID=A0A9J7KCJ8_BRAFL|nr:uncharacterized protein LOC118408656 [Branchiostoma floridae]